MDGILNVRKPKGVTSFDVVRRIKRAAHLKRVGHGGTLDPMAEGVLPIYLGRATRIIEYLDDTAKTYRAVVRLGVVTDTYDADGQVLEVRDATTVTREAVERALAAFQGDILQTPPMYSALHHQGQRLYDLARAGVEVERAPRPVTIYGLTLLDWEAPLATLSVTCSKGTYVRSLAYDLGRALGCGASLDALERTRSGPFAIEDSNTLGAIEEACQQSSSLPLLPMDYPLATWPVVCIDMQQESDIRQGKSVSASAAPLAASERPQEGLFWPRPSGFARAYGADGRLIAVLVWDEAVGSWRPHKVFP